MQVRTRAAAEKMLKDAGCSPGDSCLAPEGSSWGPPPWTEVVKEPGSGKVVRAKYDGEPPDPGGYVWDDPCPEKSGDGVSCTPGSHIEPSQTGDLTEDST